MDRYLKKIRALTSIGDELAKLSACKRLQVGAIIFPVDCSAIYSIGYNGPSKGLSNDLCTGEEGDCGCVHAEANAVVKFNNDLAKPSILYTTKLPCKSCAALILNCTNIIGVIWKETYRDDAGYTLLLAGGLNVLKLEKLENAPNITTYWKESC